MDLVDREEVRQTLYAYIPGFRWKTIDKIVDDIPSAQPEIIRCKDCKWSDWYTALDGNRYCYCMETSNGGRTEDDYCSYAERETDG